MPARHSTGAASHARFLPGDGEMVEMVRAKDWSQTPLGAMDAWPQSLKTTVSLCLACNFPVNIIWGKDHTQIYNDAYRSVCGEAHPRALGENYSVTWASAWPAIGEPFARALAGQTSVLENQRMFLTRNGYFEETFFTFSTSPIRDESGDIRGLFHPVTETTATMLAERRTRALRDLSARLSTAPDEQAVADHTTSVLSGFDFDLPFLLFYISDEAGDAYRLAAQYGMAPDTSAAPTRMTCADQAPWPVADAMAGEIVETDMPQGQIPQGQIPQVLACGPYDEPPDVAFVVPITTGNGRPPALLIAGASSRLPMNDDYRGFYQLLRVMIANAFAAVHALEDERRRAEAPAAIDLAPTSDSAGTRTAGRILLVEDNADVRSYVERLLVAEGFDVTAFADGEAALVQARAQTPDLILTDVMMPKLDGLRDIPVLLLSACAGEEARVEGLAGSADDYLAKPFTARELVARVGANLSLARIRRDAAVAIARSEARLRQIYETSFQYQGLLSPDGMVLDANATSLAGIDAALDTVAGKPYWETPWFSATPGMPEKVREAVAKAAAGETFHAEMHLNLPVGGERDFDFALRPIRDDSGAVTALVPEAVEVTERKRAEDALRQAQKIEAIGKLTGGIAHDFNNLLMVLSGGLSLFNHPLDPARREKIVASMQQAVDRGTALTRQLLTFSRRKALNPQPVDLTRQIGGMRTLLDRTLHKAIEVETQFASHLWPVEVDPAELELALLNLCVNARDAMPDGGRIVIRAENITSKSAGAPDKDFVRLSVTDTGTGMTPEVLERVFEPFFSTKDVGKGSGLGLPQVYGFAQQSGGSVDIQSAPGQGAKVNILIPRALHVPEAPEAPAPVAVDDTPADGSVLLVEDDEEVALLVKEMLEQLGYSVIRVSSAASALGALANDRKIDLVFSDIMMPGGMNGVELAREIRVRRPELPVLLTSGYAEQARLRPDEVRIEVLPKPYNLSLLKTAVEGALSNESRH